MKIIRNGEKKNIYISKLRHFSPFIAFQMAKKIAKKKNMSAAGFEPAPFRTRALNALAKDVIFGGRKRRERLIGRSPLNLAP